MRLMGVTDVDQLGPKYVNASLLELEIAKDVDLDEMGRGSKL